MKTLKWCMATLLAGLLGFAAVSAFFAWQLTSPSRKTVGELSNELPSSTQSVSFVARDGLTLSGWLTPHVDTTEAVVLLHGNGSSRRQMIARARLLYDAGYTVLLYDARGHGLSEGNRVSAGYLETADLLGAIDYLRTKGYLHIGCLGASQGGATILLAAEKLPPEVKWAIIEGTYPTIRDALDRRFRKDVHLPGWLAGALLVPIAEWRLGVSVDQINPIDHIASLKCPVFVLGGSKDQHTLPGSTSALFERANAPKEFWLVEGAAHVDLYGFAQQGYAKRILAFVQKYSNRTH